MAKILNTFNFSEIGWRPQSDKIIVVATDEEFHYAGDGKVCHYVGTLKLKIVLYFCL